MWIDSFGSRRKGRLWVERNWPNHKMLRLYLHDKDAAKEWAKHRELYHDSTYRRWWFKEPSTAIEFKLKFGGKLD